jgi:hypothetical protein
MPADRGGSGGANADRCTRPVIGTGTIGSKPLSTSLDICFSSPAPMTQKGYEVLLVTLKEGYEEEKAKDNTCQKRAANYIKTPDEMAKRCL